MEMWSEQYLLEHSSSVLSVFCGVQIPLCSLGGELTFTHAGGVLTLGDFCLET